MPDSKPPALLNDTEKTHGVASAFRLASPEESSEIIATTGMAVSPGSMPTFPSTGPNGLAILAWTPSYNPVRYWALVGCLRPPVYLSDRLGEEGRLILKLLAVRLFDETQAGPPVTRQFVADIAHALGRHLKWANREWSVPLTTKNTIRDPLGLDVPALFGVETAISDCLTRSLSLSDWAKPNFPGERQALETAIAAGDLLVDRLYKVTNCNDTRAPLPFPIQMRKTWLAFHRAAYLAGVTSQCVLLTPSPNPLSHPAPQ